eukprot:4726728-Prymnesium_polylepis.2
MWAARAPRVRIRLPPHSHCMIFARWPPSMTTSGRERPDAACEGRTAGLARVAPKYEIASDNASSCAHSAP